jgi:hypothetical protein
MGRGQGGKRARADSRGLGRRECFWVFLLEVNEVFKILHRDFEQQAFLSQILFGAQR